MKKRAYGVLGVLLLFLAAAVHSIRGASQSAEYVAAAVGQSVYKLDVAATRGMIYDCNLQPLVGGSLIRVAAAAPAPETVGALENATGGRYRERLAAALEDGKPFLLEVDREINSPYLDVFSVPQRYAEDQPAVHVIGYTDGLGGGASGIEYAMNDVLTAASGEIAVYYTMDALGHVMPGVPRKVENSINLARAGVQLTLDAAMQSIAEKAGEKLGKGAVVITQVPDCEIRACASFPGFSPLELGAAAKSGDSPLINRAFCAYAPGSVFKLIPSAVLLESGPGLAGETFTCTGSINAGGMLFYCAGGEAHGEVDLKAALEKSCNGYFISTARALGGQNVLGLAYNMGLGEFQEFGRGLVTQSGNLPEAKALENVRALANFAFGQGEITVTPVQLCGLMNTIASGGVYSTPKLISALVDERMEITPLQPVTQRSARVMSIPTAQQLQDILIAAAKEGTGKKGAPENATVGIKTGTAQTGVFDENGEELYNFWYCGFVCDETGPGYCITVLREGIAEDEGITAKVFKEIAASIG